MPLKDLNAMHLSYLYQLLLSVLLSFIAWFLPRKELKSVIVDVIKKNIVIMTPLDVEQVEKKIVKNVQQPIMVAS